MKILFITVLCLVSVFFAVLYSTDSDANQLFEYTVCKHNGEVVKVIEYGNQCPNSHEEVAKKEAIDSTLNKAHDLTCVDTEDYIPGQ